MLEWRTSTSKLYTGTVRALSYIPSLHSGNRWITLERETQMTQTLNFTHLVYLLSLWNDHKYCQMHRSSESRSAAVSSPAPPEALRGRTLTHSDQSFKSQPVTLKFCQNLLWHKSAFNQHPHSNIFSFACYLRPTSALCKTHAHTYVLSLL